MAFELTTSISEKWLAQQLFKQNHLLSSDNFYETWQFYNSKIDLEKFYSDCEVFYFLRNNEKIIDTIGVDSYEQIISPENYSGIIEKVYVPKKFLEQNKGERISVVRAYTEVRGEYLTQYVSSSSYSYEGMEILASWIRMEIDLGNSIGETTDYGVAEYLKHVSYVRENTMVSSDFFLGHYAFFVVQVSDESEYDETDDLI